MKIFLLTIKGDKVQTPVICTSPPNAFVQPLVHMPGKKYVWTCLFCFPYSSQVIILVFSTQLIFI